MRLKLNDNGASNGEFLFFFDDQLTSHMTGMSNMVPDNTYAITHSRFTVINSWPGAENDGSGKFSKKISSFFSWWSMIVENKKKSLFQKLLRHKILI